MTVQVLYAVRQPGPGSVAPAASLKVIDNWDDRSEPIDSYSLGLSYDGGIALVAPSGVLTPAPRLILRPGCGWGAGVGAEQP